MNRALPEPGRVTRRGMLRTLLAGSAAMLLAGCGPRETAVEKGNREQVLHRGIGADISDLDPHLAQNIAEVALASALFEGLVAEDPVDLHPVPGVAARWEVTPDQLHYTFHLRTEAKWSDGQPVMAADFIAAWRRILTAGFAAENAGLLYVLQGAEAYHKGATKDFTEVGVSAPDPHTLKVSLDHPTPYFLSLLTHPAWFPVPLATIAASGDPYARGNNWTRPGKHVGNGPFQLASWQPNQRIVAEKSPTYWDAPRVRLSAIHFYPIESADAEERAFRTGQLHVTYVLPIGKVDTYRNTAADVLRIDPYLNTYFLRLNTRRPPFNNEKVRQALALAVDRDAIVGKILRGGQLAATSFTPPGLPGYTPPITPPANFQAARALLTEAGYPGGKGLPPIEVLYNTSANHRLLAEAIQEMWRRELSLDVRLVNQELKVVLSERRAGHYQVLFSDWVGDYLDPATFLNLWRTGDGNNHTGWGQPEYDSLLFAAARNPEKAARAEQLRRAEALMLADAPIIPLYFNTHGFLKQPSVQGWHPTLLDHHPYKHVWLEQ